MFLKWKKLIYKLIIIASVLGFSNSVKADEVELLPSFSDFIDTYGVSGDRVITTNFVFGGITYNLKIQADDDVPVLVFDNTREKAIYCYSNSMFKTSQKRNDQADDFVTPSYGNIDSVTINILSSKYNMSGTFYGKIFRYSSLGENDVDVVFNGTLQGWDDYLADNPNNPNKPDPSNPQTGKMPYFYLKTNSNALGMKLEYTVTWETAGSFVEGKEDDYAIRFYVSSSGPPVEGAQGGAYFTGWDSKKAIGNSDVYPTYFSQNAWTCTYEELEKLYLMWGSYLQQSFVLTCQIVDSNNQPVNNKYVTFRVTKKFEVDNSIEYEYGDVPGEGSARKLTEREEGVMNYTDDRPTGQNTTESGERSSDGSSVSPSAVDKGVNNWTPTQSQVNGVDYGTSLNDLSSNLQGLVGSISYLSTAFASIFSWFPAWLTTLIAVSLGMIVVIGTIKLILR